MDNRKSNLLLLLGCQRSGTTLLAAMLGRHSEISMLFESTTDDTKKLIGKKYCGNKLLAWRQIRINSTSSKFGHLINRVANFDFGLKKNRHHKVRIFPTSALSIQDYLDDGAKIITIFRNKQEVVNSITNRTKMSEAQASIEYDRAVQEMQHVQKEAFEIQFDKLVNDPVQTLKEVCQFLGLDYEDRMLEGTEYNFVYPHSSVIKGKSTSATTKE